MKSVVYITHNEIQFIAYRRSKTKVKILKTKCEEISETAIINGIITDNLEVTTKLKKLYEENKSSFKNVKLILDSSNILTKKMAVPDLKKWQYEKLVRDELGESITKSEDYIFDYTFVDKKYNQKSILACGVSKELISSYVDIFKEINIKLKSIQIGFESIIEYMSLDRKARGKSVVLNILDGPSMISMIFQNGQLVFSKRSRILAENNSAMVVFLLNELSTLLQFNKSQNLTPLTQSYYIGISNEVLLELEEQNPNEAIDILKYSIPKLIENSNNINENMGILLFSILANKQDINLLETFHNSFKKKKERKPFKISYVVYPLLVLAIVGTYGYLKYDTSLLQEKVNTDTNYLNNEDVINQLNIINQAKGEITSKNNILTKLNAYQDMINSYPKVTTGLLNYIFTSADTTIMVDQIEFDSSKKILTIDCTGTSPNDATNYIYKLKENKNINKVEYDGYKSDELGNYRFTVNIVMGNREVK